MAASSFHSSNLQRHFIISSSFFFHSKTRTINHLLSDLCLSTSTIRSESTRRVQLSFPRKLLFSCQAKLVSEADESFNINVVSPALLTAEKEMATQAAASSFNGNVKKALAGLRRINLEGLRWRVFDAKDQVLGRLASRISTVIQGKDKPTYTPNRDDGDMCIVLNAKDICVTGRKLTDKVYHWHTGYVGNLKERSLKDQMAKDPTEVIRKAVLRMLPRNKLRDDRDRKLRIFSGGEHPFGDRPLEPYIMPPRKVRELRPRARRAMIRAQKKAEQQQNGDNDSRKGRKREEKLEVIA